MSRESDLEMVLRLASAVASEPDQHQQLLDNLSSGRVKVPTGKLLQDAQLKLDMLVMVHQRSLLAAHTTWRYPAADASKQKAWDYFNIRTDRFRSVTELL